MISTMVEIQYEMLPIPNSRSQQLIPLVIIRFFRIQVWDDDYLLTFGSTGSHTKQTHYIGGTVDLTLNTCRLLKVGVMPTIHFLVNMLGPYLHIGNGVL